MINREVPTTKLEVEDLHRSPLFPATKPVAAVRLLLVLCIATATL